MVTDSSILTARTIAWCACALNVGLCIWGIWRLYRDMRRMRAHIDDLNTGNREFRIKIAEIHASALQRLAEQDATWMDQATRESLREFAVSIRSCALRP